MGEATRRPTACLWCRRRVRQAFLSALRIPPALPQNARLNRLLLMPCSAQERGLARAPGGIGDYAALAFFASLASLRSRRRGLCSKRGGLQRGTGGILHFAKEGCQKKALRGQALLCLVLALLVPPLGPLGPHLGPLGASSWPSWASSWPSWASSWPSRASSWPSCASSWPSWRLLLAILSLILAVLGLLLAVLSLLLALLGLLLAYYRLGLPLVAIFGLLCTHTHIYIHT